MTSVFSKYNKTYCIYKLLFLGKTLKMVLFELIGVITMSTQGTFITWKGWCLRRGFWISINLDWKMITQAMKMWRVKWSEVSLGFHVRLLHNMTYALAICWNFRNCQLTSNIVCMSKLLIILIKYNITYDDIIIFIMMLFLSWYLIYINLIINTP